MIEALRSGLAARGFAITAAGTVGPYNREIAPIAPGFVLPDFGRDDALVVLVGNGGELLDALREAAAADPALSADPHPVERFARETVAALARAHLGSVRYELRFSSDKPPRAFAAVRLARLLGLAETGPTQLCIHPERGPWIALRAALVVDAAGPEPPPPRSRCDDCAARPCVDAMARALDAAGGLERVGAATLGRHADLFIAARDACPVGRSRRYPEDLLRYHYTRERARLFPRDR